MLLARRENAFPSDVGPQSKEDQTEGIPEGSSLVDPLRTLLIRAFERKRCTLGPA